MAETNPLVDILKSVGATVTQAAPGLSLGKILSEVGTELKQMGAHGAHEASAALFTGSSYVMYPRGSHDDSKQTVEAPAVDAQAIEEQSRGGRSM